MSDIKDRIAKLMALANDGRGNEFEAEAALRQAEKLMRKHGIDAAELQDRTGAKPVYEWSTVLVPAGAPQPVSTSPLWFGILISAIGKFADCKVSYKREPGHGICAAFSGDATDVQYAVWLCKHLRDDCRYQASQFQGDRAERESFRKAYASRISERMNALLRERKQAMEAIKTTTGTALMVIDQKLALRDAQFGAQTYGRARSYSARPRGYEAGRSAGDRAGFGRPVGGTSPQRLK